MANNRFAASNWITPSEDRVTIAGNNQYVSTVYIKVPNDAYPCGHYASVYFEPISPTLGGQAVKIESASTVAFRLSSLIYFDVEGNCRENAVVSKIHAPGFMEYGPVEIDIDIMNRSDYHITPQVALTLNNMLNSRTDVKVMPLQNIFPDSARSYQMALGGKWLFGRYQVALSGGYGKTGKTLTAYTYVWVFPWRVTIVIFLTLLVLFLLIRSVYEKMNKQTRVLEKEIEEEKAEIESLRESLKKRAD